MAVTTRRGLIFACLWVANLSSQNRSADIRVNVDLVQVVLVRTAGLVCASHNGGACVDADIIFCDWIDGHRLHDYKITVWIAV